MKPSEFPLICKDLTTGRPVRHVNTPAQKRVLDFYFDDNGDPKAPQLGLFWTKKSGKTQTLAKLAGYRAWTRDDSEIIIALNSREQGVGTVFSRLLYHFRYSPEMAKYVNIKQHTIDFENGSKIEVYTSSASSAAGSSATIFLDEAWGFLTPSDKLRFAELIPPPGSSEYRVVSSYAGIEGESESLRSVWDLELQGNLIDEELGLYYNKSAGLVASYDLAPFPFRLPQVDESEIERLRQSLDTVSFNRMFLNHWGTVEGEPLMNAEIWDSLFDPDIQVVAI